MYDYLLIDATNQFARARYAAQSSSLLNPLEEHHYNQLKKLEERTEQEQKEFEFLRNELQSATIGFAVHLFFSIIFSSVQKFPAKKLVLAWDKGSWRYKVYPDYKCSRKKKRQEQNQTEKEFQQKYYDAMKHVIEQFNCTNIINLHITECEADDIIGVLCTAPNKSIMIITSDSDFHQLLMMPWVSIYDPIKKQKILKTIDEARYSLLEKIIRGDTTDSIPSSYPRLRKTKIQHWNENPVDMITELEHNEAFNQKYKRNKKLIAFTEIPSKQRLDIFKAFTMQMCKEKNIYSLSDWVGFLKQYKLKQLISELDKIHKFLY